MYAIHRILVAIKDPRARSHAAINKAGRLARALGAEVQLFHAIADPIYIDAAGAMAQVYPDFERDRRDWYLQCLEALARPLRRRGVNTSVAATWDFPICEAIVRQAAHFEADLIMAECHPTTHHAPWLLRFTDWELLRLSPVPVLLVKSHRLHAQPTILAAVDPTHAFAKPADLDAEILRHAATLADALQGALHAVHAYGAAAGEGPHSSKLRALTSRASGLKASKARSADSAERLRACNSEWCARSALQETVRWNEIPEKRRHLVQSQAAQAIEDVARKTAAGMVVMGAISRSGLSRLVIGNTAERVLDHLNCDVLVVKPRNFRNLVARQPRGVQMVALPA